MALLQRPSNCRSSYRTLWYQFLSNLKGVYLNVSKPSWETCDLLAMNMARHRIASHQFFLLSWLAYIIQNLLLRVCSITLCVKPSYLLVSAMMALPCVQNGIHNASYLKLNMQPIFHSKCAVEGLLEVCLLKAGPLCKPVVGIFTDFHRFP